MLRLRPCRAGTGRRTIDLGSRHPDRCRTLVRNRTAFDRSGFGAVEGHPWAMAPNHDPLPPGQPNKNPPGGVSSAGGCLGRVEMPGVAGARPRPWCSCPGGGEVGGRGRGSPLRRRMTAPSGCYDDRGPRWKSKLAERWCVSRVEFLNVPPRKWPVWCRPPRLDLRGAPAPQCGLDQNETSPCTCTNRGKVLTLPRWAALRPLKKED